MPSNDFRPVHAPIAGPRVSRWVRVQRGIDLLGHFMVGGVVGFIGGLVTASIAIAALIGVVVGLGYTLLRMRFGSRLDSGLQLSPQQVEDRARARANRVPGAGSGLMAMSRAKRSNAVGVALSSGCGLLLLPILIFWVLVGGRLQRSLFPLRQGSVSCGVAALAFLMATSQIPTASMRLPKDEVLKQEGTQVCTPVRAPAREWGDTCGPIAVVGALAILCDP